MLSDYIISIVSIISTVSIVGTCFGSLLGVVASARLTNFRLESLEKKVDKHNNFAERIPVLENTVKSINHRIDNIEREVENNEKTT